jgi:redox-sensitive bicupin YhaK (pirin superfamily)
VIELRKGSDRALTRLDWLESRHSFSFGHHYDPQNLGFGPLRVINEDRIAPSSGFPSHPHRDMEILTYMLTGTLTHHDSEGNAVEIRPGRIQVMHAGSGIVHSEMNFDAQVPVHLLQIWLEPDALGLQPGHAEFDFARVPGEPVVLASKNALAGGVSLAQDATLSALTLAAGQTIRLPLASGRRGWVQLPIGRGRVAGIDFEAGDAFAIKAEKSGQEHLDIEATEASEMLIFSLA